MIESGLMVVQLTFNNGSIDV